MWRLDQARESLGDFPLGAWLTSAELSVWAKSEEWIEHGCGLGAVDRTPRIRKAYSIADPPSINTSFLPYSPFFNLPLWGLFSSLLTCGPLLPVGATRHLVRQWGPPRVCVHRR